VPTGERTAVPPRHEPDYTMTNFMVQRFAPDGSMRVQIEGDQLRHYPDTDTLEIDNARIRAIGSDARVTVATATRALSNGDASELQLVGSAHVIREAVAGDEAIEFRSEFLHAFLTTERVQSHLPVTVRRGATEVHAAGIRYDNLARLVDLKGPMAAVFAPARGGVK
jgi:lipopolysaccharide export system protein LptC